MHRSKRVWLTLLLLWPLASHADVVDVPQLGIRFAALPAGAFEPEVTPTQQGYLARIQLGKALMSIYRESDPVSAGSDVASPGYRASLDTKFAATIESNNQGAPTAVAGHGAWTVVDARPADPRPSTAYTCVTYVIVDQHLYRLTVTAVGAQRPPEFDALVKAISAITFEPIRQS